jgi:hypothetical protein
MRESSTTLASGQNAHCRNRWPRVQNSALVILQGVGDGTFVAGVTQSIAAEPVYLAAGDLNQSYDLLQPFNGHRPDLARIHNSVIICQLHPLQIRVITVLTVQGANWQS